MDSLDWGAIAIAVVAAIFIGAVWFSPMLFRDAWLKATGQTAEEMKASMVMGMLVGLLTYLFAAIVLSYVVRWATEDTFIGGVMLGATLWLGFTVTTQLLTGVYEKKPWSLTMITAGHTLLMTTVMTGIIAQMG